MQVLKCTNCGREQKTGKFCLDCGHALQTVVTSEVKFRPIETSRNSERLKVDIRKWLNRIGIENPDILIETGWDSCSVKYRWDNKTYKFSSVKQSNITNNLAAIEQFLHARVLGIERGIESVEQAFAGYAQLESPEAYWARQSTADLKQMLKKHHPDTGDGNQDNFNNALQELKRRGAM